MNTRLRFGVCWFAGGMILALLSVGQGQAAPRPGAAKGPEKPEPAPPGRTCHVDWDKGSDETGDGSAGKPWKTPWHAAGQAQGGATIIVHARSDGKPYYNGGQPVLKAIVPDLRWQAAKGEIVRISTTKEWGQNPYEAYPRASTVVVGEANAVIHGFGVWGSILVGARGDRCTIKGCDLSGGGDYQGFPAMIRTTGSPPNKTPDDWCEDLVVRNCTLHDNVKAMNQGPANDAMVLTYGAKGMIVENCEFHGGLNIGIKWKDRCNRMTARYCYFHDMPTGIQGDGQYGVDWIDTHNNVFANIGRIAVAVENGAPNRFSVRNNTFYNCAVDVGWWRGGGANVEIFNNIFCHRSGGFYQSYDEGWKGREYAYQDYNCFSGANDTCWRINGKKVATTVAAWRQWLGDQLVGDACRDEHSTSDDPGFLNQSGAFKRQEDFKRKSYPKDGRPSASAIEAGAKWPEVMGAYVAGDEVIGPARKSTSPATTKATQPAGRP